MLQLNIDEGWREQGCELTAMESPSGLDRGRLGKDRVREGDELEHNPILHHISIRDLHLIGLMATMGSAI